MTRAGLAIILFVLLSACAEKIEQKLVPGTASQQRIISLDYCADQFVLRFAEQERILALSIDAERDFSYMRNEAKGIAKVRPRAADVLALEPDLIVRSYGGGANITAFFEQAGVPVLQIGFPASIAEVKDEVLRIGGSLGNAREAALLAEEMDRRLATAAKNAPPEAQALYATPGGVTAGEGTLIHEVIKAAGLSNFQSRPGWNPLPLERLAYERPDLIAFADFNASNPDMTFWSAARHPIARKQTRDLPVVALEGAWTSCGGWFLLDAVEALSEYSISTEAM